MKKVSISVVFLILMVLISCTTVNTGSYYDVTIPLSGDRSVTVEKDQSLQVHSFKFSSDGKRMYFILSKDTVEYSFLKQENIRRDSIYQCDLETGVIEVVIESGDYSSTEIKSYGVSGCDDIVFTAFDRGTFRGVYLFNKMKDNVMPIGIVKDVVPSNVFFSPDDSNLIIIAPGKEIKVWGIDRGGFINFINTSYSENVLRISEDYGLICYLSEDNFGRITDTVNFEIICNVVYPEDGLSEWFPDSIVMNRDALYFAGTAIGETRLQIFKRDLKKDSLESVGYIANYKSLIPSPDGDFIVILKKTGEWIILNPQTGELYDRGEKITGLSFSNSDDYALVITNNRHSVNIIDLERPEIVQGKINNEREILEAEFINNNQTIIVTTDETLEFYNTASKDIEKIVPDKSGAVEWNENLLCYSTDYGFNLMDLFFNFDKAEYYIADSSNYIMRTLDERFIVTDDLKEYFEPEELIDGRNLTEPVQPPIISIGDIVLSEPYIMKNGELELTVNVVNSGPGESRNLHLSIKADDRLEISGAEKYPAIKADGGRAEITLKVQENGMIGAGAAGIEIRLVEKDFNINIPGKRVALPVIAEPEPELILAKYTAIESESVNFNNIIDVNEVINISFYFQNIGNADAVVDDYEIECRQPGVRFMGYLDSGKSITKKPELNRLASGEYTEIVQQYFIDSSFRSSELRFNLSMEIEDYGNSSMPRVNIPVNSELVEQGIIRSIPAASPVLSTVVIDNIAPSAVEPVQSLKTGGKKYGLTIFDLESADELTAEANYITGIISETVLKSGLYSIVARDEREKIFEELNFSLSALSIEENSLEIGKVLQAAYMLFGTIDKLNEGYILTLKLVQTETGELIASRQSFIKGFEELQNAVPQITMDIILF